MILLLTGLPGSYFPQIVSFWDWLSPDKVVHLLLFGILSFLMLWSNRQQYFESKKRSLISFVLISGTIYGGLTEILQAFVFVGRHGNIFDFFANMTGTFSGFVLFVLIIQKNNQNRKR
jgi:VanZ family protein